MINVRIQHCVRAQGRRFDLDLGLQSFTRRLALFGPSGAGKSLAMQGLGGLYVPDAGHISIDGTVLFDSDQRINVPASRRRIGYVAQNYQLFPHLTVQQNILFGLARGWRNPSRNGALPAAAAYWVQAFELDPLLKSYPSQLSGGQQQRVALARALATDPSILILDEPLAALDDALKKKMRKELLALQDRLNIPTLLVTHDKDDVLALAQEVHHMRHGKVVSVCSAIDFCG